MSSCCIAETSDYGMPSLTKEIYTAGNVGIAELDHPAKIYEHLFAAALTCNTLLGPVVEAQEFKCTMS